MGFTLQWYNAAGPAGPYGANGPSLAVDGTGKLLNIIPGSLGSVNVPLGLFNALQGATVVGGLTADTAAITAGENVTGGLAADKTTISDTLTNANVFTVTNLQSGANQSGMRINMQTAGDPFIGLRIAGDTNNRWAIDGGSGTSTRMNWGSGAAGTDVHLDRLAANNLTLTGADFDIGTAGRGLQIKEGSNARMGQATLVAGTVTVTNNTVTGSTRIFLSRMSAGGTLGQLSISAVTVGTNFTIISSNAGDTSTVNWLLIEPG
jgi:hypothetical protein